MDVLGAPALQRFSYAVQQAYDSVGITTTGRQAWSARGSAMNPIGCSAPGNGVNYPATSRAALDSVRSCS